MDSFVEKSSHLIISPGLKFDNLQSTSATESNVDQLNNILNLYLGLSDDLFTVDLLSEEQEKQNLLMIEKVADFLWNKWWKTDEHCEEYELNYLKGVRRLNFKIYHLYEVGGTENMKLLAQDQSVEELYLNFKFLPTWVNILRYININHACSVKLQNSPYLTELSLWFDQLIYAIKYTDGLIADRLLLSSILDCLVSPFYKQCLLLRETYCRPIDKFYIGTCTSYYSIEHFHKSHWFETIGPVMHSNRSFIIYRSKCIDQWNDDILYCIEKVVAFITKDYNIMFEDFINEGVMGNRTKLYLPNYEEYLTALVTILKHPRFSQTETSFQSATEQKLVTLIMQYLKLSNIRPIHENTLYMLRSQRASEVCLTYIQPSYRSIYIYTLPLITVLMNETVLEHESTADTIARAYFDTLENSSQLDQSSRDDLHSLYVFSALFHHRSIQMAIGRLNKIYYILLSLYNDTWEICYALWTLSFSPIIRKQLRGQIQILQNCGKCSLGLLWTLGDSFAIEKLRHNMKCYNERKRLGIQQDLILDCAYLDTNFAKQIHDGLVASGYRVWFPKERSFRGLSSLFDYSFDHITMLEKKINQCDAIKYLVVCLSEHYERNNVSRAVLHYALKKRLRVIPIIIQKHYKMQSYLEDIFNQTEIVNFTKLTFEDAIDLLTKYLDNVNEDVPQMTENLFIANITSDLFQACKNNDFYRAKECISQMTLTQLNEIQHGGATVLHAAVSNDNKEIVRLILNKGASRSIRDSLHGITAFEGALNDAVKCLFKRSSIFQRFLTDLSYQLFEWSKDALPSVDHPFTTSNYPEILITIQNICFSSSELSPEEKTTINWFFDRAVNDPIYILRAFTSVSNFSIIFSNYLLENIDNTAQVYSLSNLLRDCSSFEPFTYLGETYRGILISKDDSTKYGAGSKIIIATLLSTTKDWSQAELSALDGQGDYWRRTSDLNISYFAAICVYRIKHRRTAYAVQNISEVPDEQEVLILPRSAFILKVISQYEETAQGGIIYIFELEQCDYENEENKTGFAKEL